MTETLMQAEASTEAPVNSEASSTEAVATESTADRPSWLPEKYKSGEDLAKAYAELSSKLGTKEEDLRNQIAEELNAAKLSERPEKAGDYQLPDIIDGDEAVSNELLQWWADHSFENGYSQDKFQKGIEMYAQMAAANQPDLQAEVKRLGDNANDRIQATSAFANKFFPKETLPAIQRMCETADGIMALEVVMEAMKDGSFSAESAPAGHVDDNKLQEMMRDERYYNPARRDAGFVKQVEDGFKKLYG